MKKPTLDESIKLLRNAVKFSTVKGQKHLDLSLVNSFELEKYQLALMVTRESVVQKLITDEELKIRLGIL